MAQTQYALPGPGESRLGPAPSPPQIERSRSPQRRIHIRVILDARPQQAAQVPAASVVMDGAPDLTSFTGMCLRQNECEVALGAP